jgi:hypothetical protein
MLASISFKEQGEEKRKAERRGRPKKKENE